MFGLRLQFPKRSMGTFSDGEALNVMLAQQFPDTFIELDPVSKTIAAQFVVYPLSGLRLYCGRYRGELRGRIHNWNYFTQNFPLHGSCETINNGTSMMSSEVKGSITGPGTIDFSSSFEFEHLVILFDPEALLRTISALSGRPTLSPLKLDLSDFGTRPDARFSRNLARLLVEELDADNSTSFCPVLPELEQAMIVAFLCGNHHNYSALLSDQPRSSAQWQVRRVEEYIEANWNQPITIEALAVVGSASARSLFHSFKEHRRYTPMNFVKSVRLKHAKQMLSHRSQEATVTSVAFACGFSNLGHFASDYKRAYGEAPSATLQRARISAHC